MAKPKPKFFAHDLDVAAQVIKRPPKVVLPGCYGDFSLALCGADPFCGLACAAKCKRKVDLTKRYQVWLVHPESDCEDLLATFDTPTEAEYHKRADPDGLFEGGDGMAFYDLRDSTGAKWPDFMEAGDASL